jgi:probable phosphoglycerate mutase
LADLPAGGIQEAFLGAFGSTIDGETRFLGGETFGLLRERVLRCFEGVLAEDGWTCLLLVAHGGVNRAILAHALGLSWSGFASLEQDPCCINILDADRTGRFVARLINHTPYDAAKGSLLLTTMERLYQDYRRRVGEGRGD